MLCELETDKVTVEVPATAAGVLAEIVAKEGETVGVDALLATIDEKAGGQARASRPSRRGRRPRAEAAPARDRRQGRARPTPNRRPPTSSRSRSWCPTLGESVTEATVSTWFKKVGDAVTQDEMLCELETDKVSVEVPAPASGTLAEIYAKDGATVQAGGKLGRIARRRRGGAPAAAAPRRPPAPPPTPRPPPRRSATSRTRPRPTS